MLHRLRRRAAGHRAGALDHLRHVARIGLLSALMLRQLFHPVRLWSDWRLQRWLDENVARPSPVLMGPNPNRWPQVDSPTSRV